MTKLTEMFKRVFGAGEAGPGNIRGPVWKKINILMIVATAGVLLIVLANLFAGGGKVLDETAELKSPGNFQVESLRSSSPDVDELESSLARKLEAVLAQISGVGDITVTVNLASTTEKDYAVNTSTNNKTTQEHDQKGGNRTITETNENGQMVLVRENQGSREEPVVVKEVKPEVKGVVVVAEGAENPVIKADLMKAVQVYLDVPLYKVIVLSKESR